MAKDLFSRQADIYARYRPGYPPELFEYILSFVRERNFAWDCATGNGQAAVVLAGYFKKVFATDISPAQIEKAVRKENIEYIVCPAESTPFAENSFDLVTVAQAYHWFQWDEFRKEVMRVCKPGAIIAIWTYYHYSTGDEGLDARLKNFYTNVTGPYWDKERKLVEEKYSTVKFDYEQLPGKNFETAVQWKRDDMIGFISSWSAVQNFISVNNYSPVPLIEKEIKDLWKENEIKKVIFPVYLKLGRIIK